MNNVEALNAALNVVISLVLYAEEHEGRPMETATFVSKVTKKSGAEEMWEMIVRRKEEDESDAS